MRDFIKDFSLTAAVAGLLAVIVSYAGSSVLIFQAANLAGLSREITASWIWAVSIGSGITGLVLSWRMKKPIITAWSTPGAALLVTMLPTVSYPEAIGAYMASAVIIILIGVTGSLDALMKRIPGGISAGLLAGILFSFGAKVFTSVEVDPLVTFAMVGVFLVAKRFWPRYAVVAVMLGGIIICAALGRIQAVPVELSFTLPVFTSPAWSAATILSVGVPLALVTLTGQYISGMAVLHASGYPTSAGGIMAVTGLFSFLLAPFGSHAVNLSSLTAAICTSPDASEDPGKRYVAGMVSGALYILVGVLGTTITVLFASLPPVYIAVLAGLALLGAFVTGFAGVVRDVDNMEAGIITFLVTASGMQFMGLYSPFWGLVLGGIAAAVLKKKA